MKDQMVRFGLILGVICLSATLVLAVSYEVTKPKIDEQLRKEEEAALKEILPEAESFKAGEVGGIEYSEARKGKDLIGYSVKVTANGYNGFIRIIVGVDPEGTIKGVRVLEHHETPGLGARINEIRPGEKDAWFLRQFAGKRAAAIEVKKNIDAITGATTSSKAVTDAINNTVKEFLSKVKE
jgi:electron transport complex protein RnfG